MAAFDVFTIQNNWVANLSSPALSAFGGATYNAAATPEPTVSFEASFVDPSPVSFTILQSSATSALKINFDFAAINRTGYSWVGFRIDYIDKDQLQFSYNPALHPTYAHFHDNSMPSLTGTSWVNPTFPYFTTYTGFNGIDGDLQNPQYLSGIPTLNGATEIRLSGGEMPSSPDFDGILRWNGFGAHQVTETSSGGGDFYVLLTPQLLIAGAASDDVLVGTLSDDSMTGGSGNDFFDGSSGFDSIDGGPGEDTWDWSQPVGPPPTHLTVWLWANYSAITYAPNSFLQYQYSNSQGSYQEQYQRVYNIEDVVGLANAPSSLSGDDNNNRLTGGSAADSLEGRGGDDTLVGGSGADSMSGGAGNDIYFVDDVGDVVTENVGEGIDTVHTTVTYALSANVENLMLDGAGSITGSGNELANILTGNAGNNLLYGNGGNDTAYGGDGNDVGVMGNGDDLFLGGDGADYAYLYGGNDTAYGGAGLDVLIGGGGNDLLIGDAGSNYFFGGDGADTLFGNGGTSHSDVNVMSGEAGNDVLYGGAGTNYFYGGAGVDTMTGGSGLNIFISSGENDGNVIYGGSGQNYIYGSNGGDTVTGGAGVDVFLMGTGADVITGGGGVDYAWGGGGSDTFNMNDTVAEVMVILDFNSGGLNDVLNFSGTSLHSFADVQAASFYSAGINTTIITDTAGCAAWLIGKGPGDLDASMFRFS